jgi:hypothetical protein
VLILTGYKDAEGYMPGKLFEYLATGLPIFATGPVDGDAANLLHKTKSGEMIDSADLSQMKSILQRYFDSWKNNTANAFDKPSGYSRRENAKLLTTLLQ